MLAAFRKYGAAVMSALGVAVDHGVTGGLSGYAVSKLIDKGAEKALEANAARKVGKSLNDLYETPTPGARAYGTPTVRGVGITESRRGDQ
jgi:N-methylhydantoinase B/oxoprolinase/acetone carboxylase alpha subunit